MSKLRTARIFEVLALAIMASGVTQAGTITTGDGNVTVTDLVTSIGGGLFQYNYTVADGTMAFGSQGLVVLDIAVTPGVSILGLAAPGGSSAFTSTIDTVGSGSTQQEFVSFIENHGSFTAAPESGFIFDSPVAPAASTFGVTLADGATASASGVTSPVVTPEPASLPLFGLGIAALLLWRNNWRLLITVNSAPILRRRLE